MDIEKLKVFLKEWKEDRVKNGNCEMYTKYNGKSCKCRGCYYSDDAFEHESKDIDDVVQYSICELLEMIEDTL